MMTFSRPLLPSLAAATLAAALLAPGAGEAQVSDSASTVETTGSAEVTLRPTSALLRVGVSSIGASAESAADSSSRKTRALRDTLSALGLDGDSLRTHSFSVSPYRDPEPPRPEPDPGERPRRYEARATLEVPVEDLSRLDRILDAVLAAGADRVPDLEYRADGTDAAREHALRAALRRARSEARALTREAGGRLGPLLHASSPPGRGPGRAVGVRALESVEGGASGVSLVPRDVVIEATVTARWSVEWPEPDDGGGP